MFFSKNIFLNFFKFHPLYIYVGVLYIVGASLTRRNIMAPVNQGYLREDEMIEFLNNKKVANLSSNLRSLLVSLFGVVDPEEVIKCEYGVEFTKPDFVITYKGTKKYVSMKSGNATIVHSEQVETFIPFLRSIGISEETLKTILLHQYGDGTTKGTGKKRYNNREVYKWLELRIRMANDELNQMPIIEKVINRAIFQGVLNDVPPADAIYHGNYESGYVATKQQIMVHLEKKDWSFFENLHCGPLLIRPHARYVDMEIRNPYQRNKLVLYWPKMKEDIKYISSAYNNYISARYLDQIEEEVCKESNGTLPQKKGLFSWVKNRRW